MRFNVRPLILGLSGLFLLACSSQKIPSSPSEVQDYLQSTKNSKAEQLILVKQSLERNKESDDIRALLANVQVAQGLYVDAALQYERIDIASAYIDKDALLESLYFSTDDHLELVQQTIEYFSTQELSFSQEAKLAMLDAKANNNSEAITRFLSQYREVLASDNISTEATEEEAFKKLTLDTIRALSALGNHNAEYLNSADSLKIAQSNNAPWLSFLISNYYLMAEGFDDLVSHIDHVIEARPLFPMFQTFKAEALIRDNQSEAAQEILVVLSQRYPDNSITDQMMARIAYAQEDFVSTKGYIEQSIAKGYQTRFNYLLAGEVNFFLENYESSINFLQRGLDGMTADTPWHEYLYFAMGRVSEGSFGVQEAFDTIREANDIQKLNALRQGLSESGNSFAWQAITKDLKVSPDLNAQDSLKLEILKLNPETGFSSDLIQNARELLAEEKVNESIEREAVEKAKVILLNNEINNKGIEAGQTLLRSWIQAAPEQKFNYLLLADMNIAQGNWSDAQLALEQADIAAPVVDYRYTQTLIEQSLFEEALESAKQSLQLYPASIPLMTQLQMIKKNLNRNDYKFEESLVDDTNPNTYLALAFAYSLGDKNQEALNTINKGIELGGVSEDFIILKLENQFSLNDQAAADESLAILRSEIPLKSSIINRLNSLLRTVNNLSSLEEVLREQLSLQASDHNALALLAELMFEQQRFDEIIKVLDKKRHGNERLAQLNAIAFKRTGQFGKANDAYSRLISRYDSVSTQLVYTQFLIDLNKLDDAKKRLETLLQEQPTTTEYVHLLASLYDASAAIELYEEYLVLVPNNVEALANLGYLYMENGEWDKADKLFDKALALSPENEILMKLKSDLKNKSA